jgi:hypothetical protein
MLVIAAVLILLPGLPAAQGPALPLDDAAIEAFLAKARVIRTQGVAKGVTGSLRVTLTDGTLTHDAHVQMIDESRVQYATRAGVEFNFRDSWRFNIAAYRIDRLLGLDLVPVSVERRYQARPGAFTWWVDDVLMDEEERYTKKVGAPDTECWNAQMRLVRVFDALIDNTDRNLGNLLITKSWRLWAIDHTRAFRPSKTLRKPQNLTHIDRVTLERMKALNVETLGKAAKRHISTDDIRALLARRDAIVAHFAAAGETALYQRPENCPAR